MINYVSICNECSNPCIQGKMNEPTHNVPEAFDPTAVCSLSLVDAQVDTSAANSTSEGLMWLRLVQSARDRDEQNLEAYVKNGQLFYRSLRRIEKDEELLVWYGKDLIELLVLSSSKAPAKNKSECATAVGILTSLDRICCYPNVFTSIDKTHC